MSEAQKDLAAFGLLVCLMFTGFALSELAYRLLPLGWFFLALSVITNTHMAVLLEGFSRINDFSLLREYLRGEWKNPLSALFP